MLAPDQSPFPDNPTCKLCITKPCRQLFAGRVYPGKMIFVHHSEFLSLPCHKPNFSAAEEADGEEAALTDDIVVITGKIELSNPRWQHSDPDRRKKNPETLQFGDTINLMVDIKNYPDGGPVTFDIYDNSENPPLRVDSVQGTNENGVGKCAWAAADKSGKGSDQKLEFEATARSKASLRAPLAMSGLTEFELSF